MNENIENVLAVLDEFRTNDEMSYSAYSTLHDIISLLDDLLKEQEPVKPIKPIYQGDDSYTCDNCGETVGWEEMECYGIGKIRYKYCPGCGRKVKWE